MPCHDDGRGYPDEKQKRLDLVTRVACAAMNYVDSVQKKRDQGESADELPMFSNREAWHWWSQHKKYDEARLAKEEAAADASRLRKAALSRLTPEEIEALGIKK